MTISGGRDSIKSENPPFYKQGIRGTLVWPQIWLIFQYLGKSATCNVFSRVENTNSYTHAPRAKAVNASKALQFCHSSLPPPHVVKALLKTWSFELLLASRVPQTRLIERVVSEHAKLQPLSSKKKWKTRELHQLKICAWKLSWDVSQHFPTQHFPIVVIDQIVPNFP